MKRVALILAGLFCLPMVGSSRVWGEDDSVATQRGTGLAIDWHTIDGGGVMQSTGGDFVLSGTIGQHDAGPSTGAMTGVSFELVGGFWPVASVCPCLGDMNGDGVKDGLDIQEFADCVIAGGSCSCADVDAMGGVTIADVAAFVDELLGGPVCP